ncbi:hypothetical protein [uncultured Paraglaciecola sp.]|uniref:hypothetical protein n=1 Tax=uncultured Paraglaciecola sp. TaxID=1765024 RepID=UPI00260B0B20|nr:hypothetical protein [uncultured Paraglaciecola sp.]
MTNRAETIMAAIAPLLTGLTTTGANVQRSRAWPVDALPALTIQQGSNTVNEGEDEVFGAILRTLEFSVISQIKGISLLETQLNQIAAEVYAALTADRKLGLAYVFDVRLVGDSEPELEAEQDEPTARQTMTWRVVYEHSETSTEV